MNRSELIKAIAKDTGETVVSVSAIVDSVFECITQAMVDGEDVVLPQFGKFHVTSRNARKGTNPATGEKIDIPAKDYAKFTARKVLKDALNS